jgi:hypothetical protein
MKSAKKLMRKPKSNEDVLGILGGTLLLVSWVCCADPAAPVPVCVDEDVVDVVESLSIGGGIVKNDMASDLTDCEPVRCKVSLRLTESIAWDVSEKATTRLVQRLTGNSGREPGAQPVTKCRISPASLAASS